MLDCSQVTDIPPDECLALLDFYVSTNGEMWQYGYDDDKWNTSVSCEDEAVVCWFETPTAASWKGVTVVDGHVSELVMDNFSLSGYLPSSIVDLPYLTEICLMSNEIGGTLPEELGELAYLEQISLSHNSITGEIPSSFGNLANLEKIMIGNNQLSGSIPEELGQLTKLDRIFLYGNHLSGELPSSLGQLTMLKELIIYDNNFSGLIPSSFTNLVNLVYFYFFATDLCERTDPDFLAWKATFFIPDSGKEWQGTGCVCRIYFPIIFR